MPEEFVVTAPGTIEYRHYEEPPLEPHQARVRSLMSGIKTGTEIALFKGATPFLARRFDAEYRLFLPAEGNSLYPCNLGSWLAGEVVEAGSAVSGLRVGDLVHGGMPHRPTNVVEAANLHRVPEGVNLETELFVDPAVFALQAVHDARIKVGDRVAIFGMGVIGLLAVQLARMSGAESVTAVDTVKDRLEMAERFGASETINPNECDPALAIKDLTGRKGADVAIEISGSVSALEQAIRCVHREGLVVAASYYKDSGPLCLGAEWHHNRITMLSSMAVWDCSHRSYPMWDLGRIERTVIRMLESGKLETGGMITHRFNYTQAPAAYALLENHLERTVKVLFIY